MPSIDDVVGWAHHADSERVPDVVIDAITYRHPLGDALKVGRLRGELLAMAAFVGLLNSDRNMRFRGRVLATLILGQLPTDTQPLEALLDAEIARYATAWHRPTVSMACYLNALARPVVSTAQIWAAKNSAFDNQALIDGQFCVVGGGVDRTLTSLQGVDEMREAHEYLCAMRDNGEFDDLNGWRERMLLRLRDDARTILGDL